MFRWIQHFKNSFVPRLVDSKVMESTDKEEKLCLSMRKRQGGNRSSVHALSSDDGMNDLSRV